MDAKIDLHIHNNIHMKYSEKIRLHIDWFFKRQSAKRQIRRRKKSDENIRKSMSIEQREIFGLVVQVSSDYPEAILYDRFDKGIEETMIYRPHLLIIMSNETVQIMNTKGFHPEKMPKSAYLLLENIVDKNAHRYRRGLKYSTKQNLISFLQKTAVQHKK